MSEETMSVLVGERIQTAYKEIEELMKLTNYHLPWKQRAALATLKQLPTSMVAKRFADISPLAKHLQLIHKTIFNKPDTDFEQVGKIAEQAVKAVTSCYRASLACIIFENAKLDEQPSLQMSHRTRHILNMITTQPNVIDRIKQFIDMVPVILEDEEFVAPLEKLIVEHFGSKEEFAEFILDRKRQFESLMPQLEHPSKRAKTELPPQSVEPPPSEDTTSESNHPSVEPRDS